MLEVSKALFVAEDLLFEWRLFDEMFAKHDASNPTRAQRDLKKTGWLSAPKSYSNKSEIPHWEQRRTRGDAY